MCGFSGIISNDEIQAGALLNSLSAIKHRGPDDSLIFSGNRDFFACGLSNAETRKSYPMISTDLESSFFWGFNRLSIVDLSANGMQPFYDEESETAFMLNGEIYNYTELKAEFLAEESFRSNSDSEVAFKLFLKLGERFIHHLRGMFSIVVYNFRTNQLTAWRDRLGMKPFYYSFISGKFIFSSEMKGILATNEVTKKINYQGLAYSMYLETCPAPLTIYEDIKSLPPAFKLEFSLQTGDIKTEAYWRLEYNPSNREIDFDDFNSDMIDLCRLHNTGEVEKALMLSGGIDSGTLAWYFSKIEPKLKCLNIFASNHATDEREFAQINATNAGLDLTFLEIPALPSTRQINETMHAEEEPNSIPEPAIFLCNQARKMGIEILFSALGPDEIFGGYTYFKTINKLHKAKSLLKLAPTVLLPENYREKFSEVKRYGFGFYPAICRRLFTWSQITAFLKARNQDIPEHPLSFLKNQVEIIYPEFNQLPILKQASYLEIFYFISSHHTFRSDQPSMRYSIEMRFPFLDHHFIQKYFNQADTFDNLEQDLKPAFRKYAHQILPEPIFSMKKKGFSMPAENYTLPVVAYNHEGITPSNASQVWYLNMLHEIEKAD